MENASLQDRTPLFDIGKPRRISTKRRALVFSPVPTHPTTHGNRARVVSMIDFLQGLGFEVHVAVLLREDRDEPAMRLAYGECLHLIPYSRPSRQETMHGAWSRRARQIFDSTLRYAYGGDDWYDNSVDKVLHRLDNEIGFDLAVVEYGFMSRALLALSSPQLKVIDTHDVFANRHMMFLNSGMVPSFYSTTPDEEKRCLLRANLILGIQPDETRQLLNYGLDAITFGHLIKTNPVFEAEETEFDLLMVGSANAMNVQGLVWFGQEVLPLLASAAPPLRIAVAGGICGAIPDFAGITKLGVISDLRAVYARSMLAINPVKNGTGVNIKSIEAMAFGVPLLSTKSGIRGLEEGLPSAFVVADDPEVFAWTALALLSDKEKLRNLSLDAVKLIEKLNYLHATTFRSRLIAIFPDLPMSVC
jgi:polysaccharide biosynthesis protein PslH